MDENAAVPSREDARGVMREALSSRPRIRAKAEEMACRDRIILSAKVSSVQD